MQKNVREVARIVGEFRDLIKDIKSDANICSETINEADKAFGDIRHYCELKYPVKRSSKTKVCRLIHDYSLERRIAKDYLEVITPLVEYLEGHPGLVNDIGRIANQINKTSSFVNSERKYVPRVLEDLFKGGC